MSPVSEHTELVEIHERDFQNFSIEHDIYHVPVDESEEERLVLQAAILLDVMGGRFFLAPIQYPRRILECGYGQLDWAIAVAEEFEQSTVIAWDIFPVNPADEPENLYKYIENLNQPLNPEHGPYDLIHSRCVGPGIKKNRWRSYVRELAGLLMRGGWLQMGEFYCNIQSDNGRLTDDHAVFKWGQLYRTAMEASDRNPRVGSSLQRLLTDAGLSNVQTHLFNIPIGTWPTDPEQRRIGAQNLNNMKDMLDSHALYPFTYKLGLSIETVEELTEKAKEELEDPRLKLYIPFYVAWAQRRR